MVLLGFNVQWPYVLIKGCGNKAEMGDGKMAKVMLRDKEIDFDVVVELMDEDIRDRLHTTMDPCSNQQFMDAYAKAHADKYNEEFVVN